MAVARPGSSDEGGAGAEGAEKSPLGGGVMQCVVFFLGGILLVVDFLLTGGLNRQPQFLVIFVVRWRVP